MENLNGEWWNCEIPWHFSQPTPLAPVSQDNITIMDFRRKSLESLSYKQQHTQLSFLL